MSLIIALLTFVLFLICLFLCLLILVQLPKKEAGMGTAFGGDAAVAVFGAGSGNALTKLTKMFTGAFLILCVGLAALNAKKLRDRSSGIENELKKSAVSAPTAGSAAPFSGVSAPKTPTASVPPARIATNSAAQVLEAISNAVKKAVPPTTDSTPQK